MVDFGKTAQDYARYRAGFPSTFFERLTVFGVGISEQNIVDLGTGTGALARRFAAQGCRVIGIDPAAPLLEQARRLDAELSLSIEYRVAKAEATGLPDSSIDAVTAGQCWHWFDRPAVATEVRRILRPNGLLVIAHLDWLPLKENVVDLTEKLILKHNPEWHMSGGCGIYAQWLKDVAEAGYTNIESFSYDVSVPYTHESWRGRIRASAGVSASLPPEKVALFDAELQDLLQAQFSDHNIEVPHRIFAVVSRAPS